LANSFDDTDSAAVDKHVAVVVEENLNVEFVAVADVVNYCSRYDEYFVDLKFAFAVVAVVVVNYFGS